MDSKSPSVCRLCNTPLSSAAAWREHAKSEWHVYNLRVSVAEPGTTITPPSQSPSATPTRSKDRPASPRNDRRAKSASGEESESESDVDTELPEAAEYEPGHCLFCDADNADLDGNLTHMSKAHSFAVPHQDDLAVDLDTLIGYLHLVIHSYGECIQCGTRRGTVEAIRHHMTAKGHCRFSVAADYAEFYNLSAPSFEADEESLRLPSGKLLSHHHGRRDAALKSARRKKDRSLQLAPAASSQRPADSEAEAGGESSIVEGSTSQLTRLTQGDQQSLAHLADYQVRSLMASTAKSIDQSRREEKQSELKLSKAGNTTMTAHFRADTSKRFRGPWG